MLSLMLRLLSERIRLQLSVRGLELYLILAEDSAASAVGRCREARCAVIATRC